MNEFDFLSRRRFLSEMSAASFAALTATGSAFVRGASAQEATETAAVNVASEGVAPPNPAIRFTGAWSFDLPKAAIILIRDSQMDALQDPDCEVDVSLTQTPNVQTLRKICEDAQKRGSKTLIIAFDEFWIQYRPDLPASETRQYYPDSPKFVECAAKISRFAAKYGLGLELSLLSPLEIGKGFAQKNGETGRWVQYREGYREPTTGQFTVPFWESRRWANNKGTIDVKRNGIRVFAFQEGARISSDDAYYPVDENAIIELEGPFEVVSPEEQLGKTDASRLRVVVSGEGNKAVGGSELNGFDRVMVVVSYSTPEMDYFSPEAKPFLQGLIDQYRQAGVELNAFYSDEIHIQQDWNYFGRHDVGQFTFRYLTDNFIQAFAEKYGEKYLDFEKYLVYFLYGQHDFLDSLEAREASQHVFSADVDGVQQTWLFRRRYYDLLDSGVVNLFSEAKRYAEKIYDKKFEARAHATWAQSPTIDYWRSRNYAYQYEYTSDFVWSNTVHQAAAACDDYFRWNDFLTGGGNDHAEGGWSDRDYYGQAIACSTGSVNDIPNAYAASWGAPGPVLERHRAIENAFGNQADVPLKSIEDVVHRDVEVLMLYPISLVACEERFGSWLVQYGYANYLTAEKLLQYGAVLDDGTVDVRGKRYRTICALFEPFPPVALLEFLEKFLAKGGSVVWSGPPARLSFEGDVVFERWAKLFGVNLMNAGVAGRPVPGRRIEFVNQFEKMERQDVMTDFLVDRIYPIEVGFGVESLAICAGNLVGSKKGNAVYLGFRPRDDQSASLGYETRTWFEALTRLGAYPASASAQEAGEPNDNPTVVSRTTPYLATRFPNGTVVLTTHYSRHKETWFGGFHRDAEQDKGVLESNPLPSSRLELRNFAVAGRKVDYAGNLIVAFRLDVAGRLVAFYGRSCDKIALDGTTFAFSDVELREIAWAPVAPNRRVAAGAVLEIWTSNRAKIRIPVGEALETPRLFLKEALGSCGAEIPCALNGGVLEFESAETDVSYYLIDARR